MSESIAVRRCESQADFKFCIGLQRRIWGFADEDVVPAALFVVAQHTGGHALCAFDGDQPVGFSLAFSADHRGQRYWHSHMAGVLPEYQNRGVGRLIKLRQREDALREDIGSIRWTFDPLDLRNAWFNLCRLGVIVHEYIPDCYGETTSPLHGSLPTDRLVAEWWVRSPRAEVAAAGNPLAPAPGAVEVEVPSDITELKKADPGRAREAQSELRRRLPPLFARGLAITGFQRGTAVSHYLLEPQQ